MPEVKGKTRGKAIPAVKHGPTMAKKAARRRSARDSGELPVGPAGKIAKARGALALVHDRERHVHFESFGKLESEVRETAVRNGLPARFLDEALDAVGVTRVELLACLGIASSTAGRVKQFERHFSSEDSERLARLARLWADVVMVYETDDGARAWLTGQVPSLAATPLRLLDTQEGFERVQRAILQLAYGVFA